MLIRPGTRSPAVRDVQRRLIALDLPIAALEQDGTFGPSTEAAVRNFQELRGLASDGLVGEATWRELVEASWRLGDRTLYLRAPALRGDDVRELQERLGALGFDVGRVDGIFGARTARALREFQANYGIPTDAIVGRSTLRALAGLPAIGGSTSAAPLREREQLRRFGPAIAGLHLVLDPGHGGDDPGNLGPGGSREADVGFAIAQRLEAVLTAAGVIVYPTRDAAGGPNDSQRAMLANALDADVFLSIHAGGSTDPMRRGAASFYFGHDRFRSEAGARLAECVQEELVGMGSPDAGAHPKTFAVLRETRMPALQIEPAHITNPDDEERLVDAAFQRKAAEAIASGLRAFARRPVAS
ncbi:MAG: N-acetylmuramoyl-L-alanine amidase [Actinomycetota bacterium]